MPADSTLAEEAARILRLSRETVHDYIRSGRLPGLKLGYGTWIVRETADALLAIRQQWDLDGIARRRARRLGRPDPELTVFLEAARSLSFVHPAIARAEERAYREYVRAFAKNPSAVERFYLLERWRIPIHRARSAAFGAVAAALAGVEGCSPSVAAELRQEAAAQQKRIRRWSELVQECAPSASDLADPDAVGTYAMRFEERWRRSLKSRGEEDMTAAFVIEQRWTWFYGHTGGFHRDKWTAAETKREHEAWLRYHLARAVELIEEMRAARDHGPAAFLRLRNARDAAQSRIKYHSEVLLGISGKYIKQHGFQPVVDPG